MSIRFERVAVLGGGLLGGSLALALSRQSGGPECRLWSRREEATAAARAMGLDGATSDLSEAVSGADLVVLSVPVGAMPDLLKRALEQGMPAGALVTDVGSVKGSVQAALPGVLQASGNPFIGSHPMAGSERGGIEAARADLFVNAACLMTSDGGADEGLRRGLEQFWESVGCRTAWLTAWEHDALVARISHLPHVLAAVGALVGLENPLDGRFGGGGLRDTTRVAGGDPGMWTEILLENRKALVGPLRQSIDEMREMLASLEEADHETLRRWLETAKSRRDAYSSLL